MLRRTFLKTSLKTGLAVAGAASAILGTDGQLLAAADSAKPLDEFGYGDVTLAPGVMQTQLEQTRSLLLSLDEDSLLMPYRKRAGLSAPGKEMGGWYDEVPRGQEEKIDHGFAPGHTFGQWISALSRGYAIDGDPASKAKVDKLLALYDPTISGKFYTNFRFPAYVYEKLLIGLIDAHEFAGSASAFKLLDRTTDAAAPHLPPKAIDRDATQKKWRASVGDLTVDDFCWDEPYTLPENLYLAAKRGAGDRYRTMAPNYLLDETYFNPLAEGKNVLPGHHAYSFCNALNSAMQAYLVGGSEKHLRAATNGFDMIATTQSYATGGWGPNENFDVPGTGGLYSSLTKTHSSFETPCGSYAHSKLTRALLRVTRDGRYGDSLERVLYNTVMGAKPLEKDGRAFYYSDFGNSAKKVFFGDVWPCCAGTLPQMAADYRKVAYFHDADGVYVSLYLPSTVKWTAGNGAQVNLTQAGGYPLDGRITLVVRANKSANFAMRLRIPAWAGLSGQAAPLKVNGLPVSAPVTKGFASIQRKWKDGDHIELNLPMPMRLEAIDALHPDTVALVRGPLVLFALTEDAPKVTREQLLAAKQMKGQAMWTASTEAGPLLLTPFTEIHEERYRTYITVAS